MRRVKKKNKQAFFSRISYNVYWQAITVLKIDSNLALHDTYFLVSTRKRSEGIWTFIFIDKNNLSMRRVKKKNK